MIAIKIGGVLAGSSSAINDLLRLVQIRNEKKERTVIITSAIKGATNFLLKSSFDVIEGKYKPSDCVDVFKSMHSGLLSSLDLSGELLESRALELTEVLSKFTQEDYVLTSTIDEVLRFGEDFTVCIINAFFKQNDLSVNSFYSTDRLIITDDNFGSADILIKETESNIKNKISAMQNDIVVIPGFSGTTKSNLHTTTGRNSSDYTACVVAGLLGCKIVYICKDVEGIMTGDPHIIDEVKCVNKMSFEEALEISELGGRVIHPKAIRFCLNAGISIKLCKLNAKDDEGTVISKKLGDDVISGNYTNNNDKQKSKVDITNGNSARGDNTPVICLKNGTIVITIKSSLMVGTYGFLEKIFKVFTLYKVSVDMISTSQSAVSVTIDGAAFSFNREPFNNIINDLKKIGDLSIKEDCSTIGVVTCGCNIQLDVAQYVIKVLKKMNCKAHLFSQSDLEMGFCFVIDDDNSKNLVRALHQELKHL